MHERIKALRALEPDTQGRVSYKAILEAAAGLFDQFPAEAITLKDILSTAGVSNQTLYNYFPEGRDDIALVLFDRYQRTVVHDFRNAVATAEWDAHLEDAALIKLLSACLARACFAYLKANFVLLGTLVDYLSTHRLITLATHTATLEAATARELTARFGARLPAERVPTLAKTLVFLCRGMADMGIRDPGLPLADLECQARLFCRTAIDTALKNAAAVSGGLGIHCYTPADIAVVPPRLNQQTRRGILERILNRKKRE